MKKTLKILSKSIFYLFFLLGFFMLWEIIGLIHQLAIYLTHYFIN